MHNNTPQQRDMDYARALDLAGWFLFIAIYLLVGAVGHDPWWKRGETYSFGIIYHFYVTNTWLIPVDAGFPFMEKPPLYYWTAHVLCDLLGGILPLHDAARLSSVVYNIIGAFFVWLAARELFKQKPECKTLSLITLMLYLGTQGLVQLGHAMVTDVALLAGTAVGLYGMAILCMNTERWKAAGFWLGLGVGITFMSKGFVLPAIMGISGITLWVVFKRLHTFRTLHAVLFALLVASPFLFIWPVLLYRESHELFHEWFWANNFGRFFGFSLDRFGTENNRLHLLIDVLPIFAFPVLPLAIIEVIRSRRSWRAPEHLLPLVFVITAMLVLFSSATGRTPYLLPLLPGLALLAAPALMHVRAGYRAGWNIFARIAFTFSAVVIWLTWWSLSHPVSERPLRWLSELFYKRLPSNYIPAESHWVAFASAVFVAVFWLNSLRLERRSAESTARIWFMGAALIWCTLFTLLSPWINETRSYRTVLTQLANFVQKTPYANDCIGQYNLGENVPPMLQYFTHKTVSMPVMDLNSTACPLILTFAEKNTSFAIDARWNMIWKGLEFQDLKGMEVRLYERKK